MAESYGCANELRSVTRASPAQRTKDARAARDPVRSGWRRRGHAPRGFYTAGDAAEQRRQRIGVISFLAFAASAASAALAYLRLKRSTRPAVSSSFCLPVKKGWQLEQISTRTRSPLWVERVLKAAAAGAMHRNFVIIGVNTGFHGDSNAAGRSARLPRDAEQRPRR